MDQGSDRVVERGGDQVRHDDGGNADQRREHAPPEALQTGEERERYDGPIDPGHVTILSLPDFRPQPLHECALDGPHNRLHLIGRERALR